ncbi:hypothetical protein [Dyella subtropica]|uniref:hypothetical protein n=1 Tax=Dyella subtropica TaxID=2992127 RepID=UPI002251EE90|nr:hypothetical protein [Dyella subtropica]
MFDSLAKDTVSLIKADGTRHDNIKASVQDRRVFIHRGDLLIEAGDMLVRKMSNGGEEALRVVDPGFYEGIAGIGPHYQMRVEKLNKLPHTFPASASPASSVTYNFHGANARVNHNSVDQSTNIVGDDAVVHERISGLRQAIQAADLPETDRGEALDVVDTIEEQFKAGTPKRPVIKALLASLPQLADIAKFATDLIDNCS